MTNGFSSCVRKGMACLIAGMLAVGPALADEPLKTVKHKRAAKHAAAAKPAPVVEAPAPEPIVQPPPAEVHYSNEFSVSANSVTGDGKARSSLSDGLHYLDVFSMSGRKMTDNGYQMTYNLGAKVTDDRANDIKDFSLTNLQARWSNDERAYTVGDVLEYFSQYSLNNALKGFSYRWDDPEAARIQHLGLVWGIAYPRWDCFTGDSQVQSIMRMAYGATARKTLAPGLNAGLSLVYCSDSSRVNNTDSLFSGGVYAFDTEYIPFSGLTTHAELAMSGVSEAPGSNPSVNYNGIAFRADATGTGGPSRVSLEYERVAPKFLTPLGSATPDREKVKTKWRYKYTSDITTNCSLLWYRNNLDGSKAYGLTALQPELGATIRAPFQRSSATADVFYRIFFQNGGGTNTSDHSLGVNWRDRFNRFDSDSNLSYTLYDTESSVVKNKELTFNTALSTSYDVDTKMLRNATLRPALSLGLWNMTDDLLSKSNSVTEYALGTALELPDSNITSHVRFGQNSLNGGIGDSSDKFFASADVYYRLRSMKNAVAFAKIFYNSYSFTTSINNYRENSITAGMNVQF